MIMIPPEQMAIVCRQSTRKATQDASRPKQREFCQQACLEFWKAYPTSPENYYEYTGSGASPHQPHLVRLAADLEAGRRRAVILYDLSRLSRSVVITLELAAVLRRVRGLLVTYRGRRVYDFTTTDRSAESQLALESMTDEDQWNRIRESVRDGIYRNAARGYWPRKAPPGYTRIRPGLLVPVPAGAQEVNNIFRLVAALGVREAAEVRTAQGFPTSKSALHRLVHSWLVRGDLAFGLTTIQEIPLADLAKKTGQMPEFGAIPPRILVPQASDRQIIRLGQYAPVVSPVVAEETLERLKARQRNQGGWGLRKRTLNPSFLDALATCLHCEKPRKPFKLRSEFLGCWTRGCVNHRYVRSSLELSVVRYLGRLVRDRTQLEEHLQRAMARWLPLAHKETQLKTDVENLSAQVEQMERLAYGELAGDPDLRLALARIRADLVTKHRQLQIAQRLNTLKNASQQFLDQFRTRVRELEDRWKRLPPQERVIWTRRLFGEIIVERLGRYTFLPLLSDEGLREDKLRPHESPSEGL